MSAVKYEWRRATSIRTTWITSLLAVLSILGILLLTWLISDAVLSESGGDPTSVPTQRDAVDAAIFLNPLVLVFFASLGAMAFGHEYRYGVIRLTLTAFPKRTGIFIAKVVGTAVLVASVAALACALVVVTLGSSAAPFQDSGSSELMRSAAGGVGWALYIALIAMSITIIFRNHPLGIVAPILLFFLESALIATAGGRVEWLPDYLPMNAGFAALTGSEELQPYFVSGAWLMAGLVIGFMLFRRRDA